MISRTFPHKQLLSLTRRFWMSTVEETESKKGKSYRMPEATKQPQSDVQNKSYRMPTQQNVMYGYMNPFRSQLPLRMHNNRILLYLNKQNLTTPQILQIPFASAFVALIYLIRYNPWYLTFPASLPIMIGSEIFVFFSWIFNKKHYKYIVERVYLYNNNKIEFTFSNKIRRKLKGTEDFHMFICPDDVRTPPHNPDGTPAWSQKGSPFPQQLSYRENPQTKEIEVVPPNPPTFYGWTKYTQSYTPYIFPRTYEYANWELLVPLLNGRYIDLEYGTNSIHEDLDVSKGYASPQQQLQWIEEDKRKNEQYKRLKMEGKEASLV